MKTVNFVINTAGDGLWSGVAKAVKVVGLELVQYDDSDYGELRVYFDTRGWIVSEHGLIYTDTGFHKALIKKLAALGLSDEFYYSEQGMQGDDYVSFDAEKDFIEKWATAGYETA